MSLEAHHIALASRNQDVLEYLLQDVDRCTEWIATTAFYKALHVVEAVFANDPNVRHTYKHEVRLDTLKQYRKYQSIHKRFRVLWSASTVARYLVDQGQQKPQGYTCFADYIKPDRIRLDLLDLYLLPFESEAVQLLSPAAKGALVRYVSIPPPPSAP
jgi:hypothetical protein